MSTELKSNANEITTIWNRNFICVMVANTLMCFGHFTVNPHVASYTKFLGASDQLTGFLAGMFFGVAFAIRPISGPMVTKMDKRTLLLLTFLCGFVAMLGYAIFDSVAAFAAFRFLNGVQYSFLGTVIMTLASDNLPREKMASGMGIYTIGAAMATAVSPSIGGALLNIGVSIRDEKLGFNIIFLYSAVMLLLAMIPAVILRPDKKSKEDVASTGAWYKNIITVHAIPFAIVLLMIQMAYSLYNTYMIEFGKEQGIASISVFFTVLAVALAVSRPMSGILTDRLGAHKVIFPGMVIFALSFIIVGSGSALWMVLVGAALAALGFGASQAPLIAMSMQTVEPLKRGVASNTIYMGIDLGLFFGPLFGGFVYSAFNYATMYRTAVVPIGLSIIGFAITLPIYRKRQAELENR